MEFLIKFLAVLIASFGGHFIEYPIAECTRKKIKYDKPEEGKWMASLLGMLERALCVWAWFLGYPQFIGIWLSIKMLIAGVVGRKKQKEGLATFYF